MRTLKSCTYAKHLQGECVIAENLVLYVRVDQTRFSDRSTSNDGDFQFSSHPALGTDWIDGYIGCHDITYKTRCLHWIRPHATET